MTEAFADEINKSGGIMLRSCNKRVPIKFVVYDDQGNPATATNLHEKMATVDNVDVWGRRRLAYEIAKKSEGIYAVVNFTATSAATSTSDTSASPVTTICTMPRPRPCSMVEPRAGSMNCGNNAR